MNNFEVNSRIIISKGCRAFNLLKGDYSDILEVIPLGKDYSYNVKIRISGFNRSLYARHPNRLKDKVLRLNCGNPLEYIEITLRN